MLQFRSSCTIFVGTAANPTTEKVDRFSIGWMRAAGHVPAISDDKLQPRADCNTARAENAARDNYVLSAMVNEITLERSDPSIDPDTDSRFRGVFDRVSRSGRNRHCTRSLVRDRSRAAIEHNENEIDLTAGEIDRR